MTEPGIDGLLRESRRSPPPQAFAAQSDVRGASAWPQGGETRLR